MAWARPAAPELVTAMSIAVPDQQHDLCPEG